MDLYKLLEISRDATDAEIRAAYRKMSKTAHPDAGGDAGLFEAVKEAHDILMDEEARAYYDQTGKIKPGVTEESAAAELYNYLLQLMVQCLANMSDPDHEDLKDMMQLNLREQRNQMDIQNTELKKIKKKLLSAQKRMKLKAETGENMVSRLLQGKLDENETRSEMVAKTLDLISRVEKYLDDYEYDVDKSAGGLNPYRSPRNNFAWHR